MGNFKIPDEGLRELALFAGAGGGILGGHLLGWRTVCAVEIEPYAAGVLIARQNDGILPPFPIWDDVCTFDGYHWRGIVDVVSGGFPCQDISAAGKGAGITGERSGLWKEFARIIGEVRPRYVLVENSPVLTSRGLGTVLGDLAALGYDAEWGVLGAVDAGAPHKRERIWIAAHSIGLDCDTWRTKSAGQLGSSRIAHGGKELANSTEQYRTKLGQETLESGRCSQALADAYHTQATRQREYSREGLPQSETTQPCPCGEYAGDTNCQGLAQREGQPSDDGTEQSATFRTDWWAVEPDVGRVAYGVAARVDRLKSIGNGQVPAVVRLAWETLS